MSIKSSGVHDWPPVTSAHVSLGKADATRSLAVRPVASIQSALLTARVALVHGILGRQAGWIAHRQIGGCGSVERRSCERGVDPRPDVSAGDTENRLRNTGRTP